MGRRSRKNLIPARTPGTLDAMQAAGEIVGRTLQALRAAAKPGVSTMELDTLTEQTIRGARAMPTFLGYGRLSGRIGSPVTHAIVHGLPNDQHILKDGDLVSIDCGATLDGWVGDSAWTFGIGELAENAQKLNDATAWILDQGIQAMQPGNRLTDISHAIEVATAAAE